MATTARKTKDGLYEVSRDGKRVATGSEAILSTYGISPGNLTAPGAAGGDQGADSAMAGPDPRALADKANAEAGSIYDATKDQDIDLRESSKVIADLAKSISTPEGDVPEPPSLRETFQEERQRLGLDPLEAELAEIDSEIESINTTALVASDEVNDRSIGNRARSLRRSQVSKEAQRELAFKQIERNAIARQIDNKLSALQMTMQFTQQDFANASQQYQQEFNRSIQMINLLTGMEDREATAAERLRDNASANLNTIYRAMKDSDISFGSLTEDQKRKIRELEIQADLPGGFLESLPLQTDPLSITTRENDGVKYADILTRDPETGALKVESKVIGASSSGSANVFSSGGLTVTEQDIGEGATALEESRGDDGFVNSELYLNMYRKWTENGGLLNDFLRKYPPKLYTNPRDDSLPAFLRDKPSDEFNYDDIG